MKALMLTLNAGDAEPRPGTKLTVDGAKRTVAEVHRQEGAPFLLGKNGVVTPSRVLVVFERQEVPHAQDEAQGQAADDGRAEGQGTAG